MRALRNLCVLFLATAIFTFDGVASRSTEAKASEEIVVFAAASLKNALEDIGAAWGAQNGGVARISLAGSSKLARQIQAGAPADVFVSANVKWMDVLDQEKLLEPGTRRDLLSNSIVLIAHGNDAPTVAIESGFDLPGLLQGGKLAMAMVDSVPAGIYGKAALTSLGVWDRVSPSVAQADNVRSALALVARGEAPFGIVYATDAAASDEVKIVGAFPAETHPPIIYPASVIADSKQKALARNFLDFLTTPEARALFERQGFTVIAPVLTN